MLSGGEEKHGREDGYAVVVRSRLLLWNLTIDAPLGGEDTRRHVQGGPDTPGVRPGCRTSAALAPGSIVFREAYPTYSKRLLDRAVEVFKLADKHYGAYNSNLHAVVCPCYCDYHGYQDELMWGAAWLQKSSRQCLYHDYIKKNEVALGASDSINEFGWDNKHAGINILVSKLIGDQ